MVVAGKVSAVSEKQRKMSHDKAIVVARPYSFVDYGNHGRGPQIMLCVVMLGAPRRC